MLSLWTVLSGHVLLAADQADLRLSSSFLCCIEQANSWLLVHAQFFQRKEAEILYNQRC